MVICWGGWRGGRLLGAARSLCCRGMEVCRVGRGLIFFGWVDGRNEGTFSRWDLACRIVFLLRMMIVFLLLMFVL